MAEINESIRLLKECGEILDRMPMSETALRLSREIKDFFNKKEKSSGPENIN